MTAQSRLPRSVGAALESRERVRGVGDAFPRPSAQFYSASFTGDAGLVVDHVSGKFPHATLVGVGWSLGANILVNYLGEQETESKLAAAVSLWCGPLPMLAWSMFCIGDTSCPCLARILPPPATRST